MLRPSPIPLLFALVTLTALNGCSGKEGDSGGSGGGEDEEDGSDGGGDEGAGDGGDGGTEDLQVAWFIGTSDGQTPDGSYVAPTEEVLFIRTLDPGASTMKEEAWTVAPNGDVAAYVLDHVVDTTAGTFTSTFDTGSGVLLVEGAFDAGEAWAWTAWHSRSVYQDGRYEGGWVDSTDTYDLGGTGAARAEKGVFEPGGSQTYAIVENLLPVSQEELEARLAEVDAGG